MKAAGAAAGWMALLAGGGIQAGAGAETADRSKGPATVRGAFLYPPSSTLRGEGYWSWPGSSFDAEGQQKSCMEGIKALERELGMRIEMDEAPLDGEASVSGFINTVRASKPDGLLLVPFKKSHWVHVTRIIDEVKAPAVVLARLGVLLVDHINQLHRKSGVYLISAMDGLDAVRDGMKMIRTARWMRGARLLNLAGSQASETIVPHFATQVRNVPLEEFYAEFRNTQTTAAVRELARSYMDGAREAVEPTEADVVDAARAYFALSQVLEREKGDALMMECLPGLRHPRKHVPPCMGFMSLRDEGVPAGCQSDLNATLTLMLVQQLFDKPGFQQNAAMNTESNLYFGAHCTSPSRMNGIAAAPEPYILRSHAEAGWGCVPQVLFAPGQEVTMALYLAEERPRMLIYTGEVVRCYPKAAGGCRTNVEIKLDELEDACDAEGMHQIVFYGNHACGLRTFCQLYGIEAIS